MNPYPREGGTVHQHCRANAPDDVPPRNQSHYAFQATWPLGFLKFRSHCRVVWSVLTKKLFPREIL